MDSAVVVERLLSMSGEDTQTVDRKFREPVTTKLPTRFAIISNELPRLTDASGALAGRLIILRLTRSWFGVEDHHLFDRIRQEMSGILLWAIEGWKRLRDRGRFHQPASGAELVEAMEDLSSPVGAFVRDRCRVGPEFRVEVNELYTVWRSWCEAHGRREPGTEETFGRDLRAAVPELSRARPRTPEGRINVYVGIRLRDGCEDDGERDGETGQRGQCGGQCGGQCENTGNSRVVNVVNVNSKNRSSAQEEEEKSNTHCTIKNHVDHVDHTGNSGASTLTSTLTNTDQLPPSVNGHTPGVCSRCGRPSGSRFAWTCGTCLDAEDHR
jgi:phage/plasmid-associated DNA primase